ncbi:MAG: hypothetical protein WAQ52_00210 [Terriglobales bacterium]
MACLSFGADSRGLIDSAEQKFDHIHQNGQQPRPDPHPTELTEQEVNAYLASGKVRLPTGVESLHLAGTPGVVTATCRVDFDRVRAGRANANPLLRLFSGVHDVVMEAQTAGSNHQGRVHVNSVAIDGMEVPRFVLQMFVEKYVTPRYPGVGLDSTFALPDKIETATVGHHKLTIVQR